MGAMQHSWGTEIKGSVPGIEFSTFLCHSEVIAAAGPPQQCQPTAQAAQYGCNLWRNWGIYLCGRRPLTPWSCCWRAGDYELSSPKHQPKHFTQINSFQKCNRWIFFLAVLKTCGALLQHLSCLIGHLFQFLSLKKSKIEQVATSQTVSWLLFLPAPFLAYLFILKF